MRLILTFALAVGMASAATPLHARDVLRLQPTSPWNLHYADDSCRLARIFGEGDRQVTLIFEQFEPGDEFRLSFAGKPVKLRTEGLPVDGELRFGPNEADAEISAVPGTMGDEAAIFVSGEQRIAPLSEQQNENLSEEAWREGRHVEVPPIGTEREAAATWLQLSEIVRDDLVLETGAMDKPLAALRQCSWDTVRAWGLDVEQQKTLSRKLYPKSASASWIGADDYPRDMIRSGFQAIVNYRLMVDETGMPTSCDIQTETEPTEFGDLVCNSIKKRARFEPALDAQGKPIRSFWRQTVQFRICC